MGGGVGGLRGVCTWGWWHVDGEGGDGKRRTQVMEAGWRKKRCEYTRRDSGDE